MTVQQMLNALPVLQKMMDLKLPMKKAYKIYSLAKEIEEKRQFFIEEEKKLVQATNAEILEDGSIKFPTIEDQIKFSQEHAAMLSCELEDMPVIELSFDDLGDAEFSAKEVMALEGVINLID